MSPLLYPFIGFKSIILTVTWIVYERYVCMYVCMYVYPHTYVLPVSHVSVPWHFCVLGFMCIGAAMRATRAYIHTYDVAAHCATVARRHRYSGAMSSHIRTYARTLTWVYVSCMRWASHESYAGLHTHKRYCYTLCYCSTTPSLLVRDESAQNC